MCSTRLQEVWAGGVPHTVEFTIVKQFRGLQQPPFEQSFCRASFLCVVTGTVNR